MRRIATILSMFILLSCSAEKPIDMDEEVRQYRAIRKQTVVTGVYLKGYKYNWIQVQTEAGINFKQKDDRIDAYKEGDTIIYYVDRKSGKLLGNILE